MRKNIIYAFALLTVMVSCQERNPDLFLDLSGVYFNNISGSLTAADSLDHEHIFMFSKNMNIILFSHAFTEAYHMSGNIAGT